MTAAVDGYFHLKGKKGYRTCVFVPPTLTEKWAKEEIRHLLPDAEIHLIKRTEDLIRIHQAWIQAGDQNHKNQPSLLLVLQQCEEILSK